MRKRTVSSERIRMARAVRKEAFTMAYTTNELATKYKVSDRQINRFLANPGFGMKGGLLDDYGVINLRGKHEELQTNAIHFLYWLNIKQKDIALYINRSETTVSKCLNLKYPTKTPVALKVKVKGRLVSIQQVGDEVLVQSKDDVRFFKPHDLTFSLDGLAFSVANQSAA